MLPAIVKIAPTSVINVVLVEDVLPMMLVIGLVSVGLAASPVVSISLLVRARGPDTAATLPVIVLNAALKIDPTTSLSTGDGLANVRDEVIGSAPPVVIVVVADNADASPSDTGLTDQAEASD